MGIGGHVKKAEGAGLIEVPAGVRPHDATPLDLAPSARQISGQVRWRIRHWPELRRPVRIQADEHSAPWSEGETLDVLLENQQAEYRKDLTGILANGDGAFAFQVAEQSAHDLPGGPQIVGDLSRLLLYRRGF